MSLRMHNFGGSWQPQAPPGILAAGMHQESDGYALHQPVLVLNASYEPINVCAARRAIILVLKGIAMTEEENGHFLHAARVAMRVPSVIRCSNTAAFRTSRALCRGRIFCCATATLANTARQRCHRANSRLTTSSPALAEVSPPGRILSPAAMPVIGARAIICRTKPTCAHA